MMQYLLSAALLLAPGQQGGCENVGADSVSPAPSNGPDLGCGRCPAWTIYMPAHSVRVSRPGWYITRATELPVTRTERHCEQRGNGLFEFFEPDVCIERPNLSHGFVLHYTAERCASTSRPTTGVTAD